MDTQRSKVQFFMSKEFQQAQVDDDLLSLLSQTKKGLLF
ncbi:hypothetical protein CSC18_0775 [Klebsiella aerogenes]|nr:hypothetical protein CSC18_0775 [Klebsiella aerogenes]